MRIQRYNSVFIIMAMAGSLLVLAPAYAQDAKEEECTGPYKGYKKPSEDELAKILKAHKKWIDSRGAKGKKADLCEAHLFQAHLQKAFLDGANLQEANLDGAKLEEADLFRANLEKAHLFQAHLQKANLEGANLRGAKNLTQAQLDPACVDEKTILPKGLTRPKPCS